MFWKRKHKVEARELAESLFDEYIRKIVVDAAKNFRLDAAMIAPFEAKTKLYQMATVLMALKGEERRNPRFLSVTQHLESKVFPSSFEEGAAVLAEIRTAMRDLNDLLAPSGQRREMSWARAWLQDIGVDETNPVRLALFATHWADYHIMVVKTLREFNSAA